MRVAINGMGIAGPTLAYWSGRWGHHPVLFEQAPAFDQRVLYRLLGTRCTTSLRSAWESSRRARRGYEMERVQIVDRERPTGSAHGLTADAGRRMRGRFISVARAIWVSALAGACQGIPIHFNVSISAIAKDGDESIVTLTDGRRSASIGSRWTTTSEAQEPLAFGPEAQFERFLGLLCRGVSSPWLSTAADELTFVSHVVRSRCEDETVVMLVCRTERNRADHRGARPTCARCCARCTARWDGKCRNSM